MSDGGIYLGNSPWAAPGVPARQGRDTWDAPGSGTPLRPGDAATTSASEIAQQVARKLVVPRGPLRTASLVLGALVSPNTVTSASFIAAAFNSKIVYPLLASPGIIRSLDFQANMITTGAAAGILQLFDNDTNSPLLRTFIVNIGAAGNYINCFSIEPTEIPFLNGILAIWTPIVPAFGNSMIACNIDFESVPIGQKMDLS